MQVVNGPEVLSKYVGQSEENIRLLFADAELVCVPGVGIAESYLAQPGQNGRQVVWAAPTQLLAPKS